MFCHSNNQNEFVCDLKSDLLTCRSCPDFNSVKISQSQRRRRRERIETSSQKQSDVKTIHLSKKPIFKADFLKTIWQPNDN
jgi:hypothetical protein